MPRGGRVQGLRQIVARGKGDAAAADAEAKAMIRRGRIGRDASGIGSVRLNLDAKQRQNE